MSYAEVLLAIVRAAPPALKHHRATFRPAPAAANDPYVAGSRLTPRAFALVPGPAPPAIKAAPVAAFSALELAGMLASFILSSWVSAVSAAATAMLVQWFDHASSLRLVRRRRDRSAIAGPRGSFVGRA